MSRQHPRVKAFTIVEMLVVVGVIALLLGMLLPALSGAQKRSSKNKELNAIRQVGLAWTLYANANNDKLLPGYLDFDVQQRWRVRYEYPNHQDIPADLAGPWTWRLLPYLENDIPTVHGYADKLGYETLTLDPSQTNATPGEMQTVASPIAFEPGFGYNAYYVGGWWTMESGLARPLLYDAVRDVDGTLKPVNVLSRSVGTIRRPTTLMIFCSASLLEPRVYRKFPGNQPGSHYVVPPRLGAVAKWSSAGADSGGDISASAQVGGSSAEAGDWDPTSLLVYPQGDGSRVAAPIGRYNRLAAMLHADGHTASGTPASLTDMRKWIDAADHGQFAHE